MKVGAETLGVARSNLIDRLTGKTKPRRRYHKAQDAAVVPMITALVSARPTYAYDRMLDQDIPQPYFPSNIRFMEAHRACPTTLLR